MLPIYPMCHIPFSLSTHRSRGRIFHQYAPIWPLALVHSSESLLIEFSPAEEFPRTHPPSRMPGKQNTKLPGAALLYCRANRRLAKISCWLLSLAIKFRDSFTSLCSHCFFSSCCWHQVVLTKCTIKKREKLWNLVFLFCVSSLKTVKPAPKIRSIK